VDKIREAVARAQFDYSVREVAESILKEVKARDYVSEPIAIFYWICRHVRYTRDPRTVELVRDPIVICKQILAGQKPALDCDDMTALICALCMTIGSQCRIVTVAFSDLKFKGQRQYEHVFAQAQDPQSQAWITLDPVAGKKTKEMLSRIYAAKVWQL